MEIEKKRETSWNIDLKDYKEKISLTAVEISGEVRRIKLSIEKDEKFLEVQMKTQEFFNFLSIISAFKDVVIGEDSLILDDDLRLTKEEPKIREEPVSIRDHQYELEADTNENQEEEEKEELNPEDWDPW